MQDESKMQVTTRYSNNHCKSNFDDYCDACVCEADVSMPGRSTIQTQRCKFKQFETLVLSSKTESIIEINNMQTDNVKDLHYCHCIILRKFQ